MRLFGPGPLGRSRLEPYSEPTVLNLTRWASGLKFPLESDAGRSDRRSSRRCLDAADRILKRGRLSEFAFRPYPRGERKSSVKWLRGEARVLPERQPRASHARRLI